jgi:hypothetical protein
LELLTIDFLSQWFSTFFLIGDTFSGQNIIIFMFKRQICVIFPQNENYTLEKHCLKLMTQLLLYYRLNDAELSRWKGVETNI